MNLTFFLVNIFAVPAISMSVYYRRSGEQMSFSASWLCRYLVFTVLDLILSHGAVFAVRKLLAVTVSPDTARFTILAAVCAFVLPYVLEVLSKVLPEFKVENRKAD